MKGTPSSATDTEAAEKYEGFTAEERDAMKERAKELKAPSKRGPRAPKVDPEVEVLAKIAEMEGTDRTIAERLHDIVRNNAPALSSKLWYGMPAYARDGKIVCFFQPAQKFKARYATLGFNDPATLDDGTMWPTAFALTDLTPEDETRIAALIKKAAG